MTAPPKLYIVSERQLAEALIEWRRRYQENPMKMERFTGADEARYLLDLIAELAADYAREQ